MTTQAKQIERAATGVSLANGGDSGRRRALDFYPTPPEVTHALMKFLALSPCAIWEPACGDGAMSTVLSAYGHAVYSSDIRDTGFGVGGVDFLTAPAHQYHAIITNPPFNKSEAFIRCALQQAPIVAMLLKSQYWHAKKRKALFDEYVPAAILPLTWRPDFLNGERGGAPTMECLWTVWLPNDNRAIYQPLERPPIAATKGATK